jgi:hypothetical protein
VGTDNVETVARVLKKKTGKKRKPISNININNNQKKKNEHIVLQSQRHRWWLDFECKSIFHLASSATHLSHEFAESHV